MSLSAPRPPDEVLFEGRVISARDVAEYETVSTVATTRVWRGEVTAVQPVVAQSLSASCGLRLAVGETYLVSATPDGRPGVLGTGLCTATTSIASLAPEERSILEQRFGTGEPPRAAPPAPVPERPGAAGPLAAPPAAIVGALAAGLAAIVGALVLARRRRRASRRAVDG